MLRVCLRLIALCMLMTGALTAAGALAGRSLPDTRQFVQVATRYLPDNTHAVWLTFYDATRHTRLVRYLPGMTPWISLPVWSPDGERLSWSEQTLEWVDYHLLELPRGGTVRHRRFASVTYARVIAGEELSLSPTARHYAVAVPDDDLGSRISIGTIADDNPPLRVDAPPAPPIIGNLRTWSPEGRWLAYLQPDPAGGFTRLAVVDVTEDTATVFPVPKAQDVPYPPAWSPARPYTWTPHGLVYEVHQPFNDPFLPSSLPVSLRLYDPSIGAHRHLIDTPPDARFLEPLGVSPSGRWLIMAARQDYRLGWYIETGDSLHLIDLITGATRRLLTHDKGWFYSHGQLLPDDRTLILGNVRPSGIYLTSIDLLSYRQRIYESEAGWGVFGFTPHGSDQVRVMVLRDTGGDFMVWNPHDDDVHIVDVNGEDIVNILMPPTGEYTMILTLGPLNPATATPPLIAPATAGNPNTFYGAGGFQIPEYRLYIADDMGRSPRLIYSGGAVSGVDWSDDGRAFMFSTSSYQGDPQLMVMSDALDPQATPRRFMPAVPGSLYPPQWRPPAPG